MASYWTRKDDKSEELLTIKPWEEAISNGDKQWPDPQGTKPIRILFVCHGNICRSPMAEFIMRDIVKKAGRESDFHIESAATSAEEIGNTVYPPARRKLAEHDIDCSGKTARQATRADYDSFDYIICMDSRNLRNIGRIIGEDPANKVHLLMEYTSRPGEVADPWYTGDFEATWQDCLEGCQGLFDLLKA